MNALTSPANHFMSEPWKVNQHPPLLLVLPINALGEESSRIDETMDFPEGTFAGITDAPNVMEFIVGRLALLEEFMGRIESDEEAVMLIGIVRPHEQIIGRLGKTQDADFRAQTFGCAPVRGKAIVQKR